MRKLVKELQYNLAEVELTILVKIVPHGLVKMMMLLLKIQFSVLLTNTMIMQVYLQAHSRGRDI